MKDFLSTLGMNLTLALKKMILEPNRSAFYPTNDHRELHTEKENSRETAEAQNPGPGLRRRKFYDRLGSPNWHYWETSEGSGWRRLNWRISNASARAASQSYDSH